MAGLLEGLGGENTIKDEFGQTQSDRRDPIWSGLIRAGLLAVAGGGNLMPAQRAQYLAQAGGALADIPGQMTANRSAAAQQVLRSQQLDEGKRKVADRDRIRAMAQSPEFQEAIKAASPAEKLSIQAAVESGDVGAVNTAVGNIGKHDVRAAGLDLKERELDLKKKKADDAAEAKGGWGNSFEGRARTILGKGRTNPDLLKDPEFAVQYAQAYEWLDTDNRPVTIGGATTYQPKMKDIGDYPKPGAAPAPGSPSAGQGPWTPPPPGEQRENPDKSVTWTVGDEVYTEHPDLKTEVRDRETGRKIRTEEPKPISDSALKELAEQKGFRAQMQTATANFLAQWKAATPGERALALTGAPTKLNTAWTNVALIAKGKNLYELGVLNVGDLPQLQKALADPSSTLALFAGAGDVEHQIAQMMGLMNAKLEANETALKEGVRRRPKPGASSDGKPEFITGPDGKPMLKPK